MKKIQSLYIIMAFVTAFISACSNPADDVSPAAVSEVNNDGSDMAMEGDKYLITDASTIGFIGSKVTGSHDGGFKEFDGEFYMVGDDYTSAKGKVVIDMNSTWSDSDKLTGHLKNQDFFEVETYPTSTFMCTGVKKNGDQYTVSGSLDLHGITKAIEFPAMIGKSGDEITLNAEFKIKRFDWGIVYKGQADNLIYDDVVIKLDLKAQKA